MPISSTSPAPILTAPTKADAGELCQFLAQTSKVEICATAGARLQSLALLSEVTTEGIAAIFGDDQEKIDQLLCRINTPYFGLRNKLDDLGMAITLLGGGEVLNLAFLVALAPLYEGSGEYKNYNREKLWRHSIGVAAVARLIAQITGKVIPEEAFLAGLLHDLGYTLVDHAFRQQLILLLDNIDSGKPLPSIEQDLWNFNHSQAAAAACESWGFSERIIDAILWHHEPSCYEGPHSHFVNHIAAADYLCRRTQWKAICNGRASTLDSYPISKLGMNRSDMKYLLKVVPTTLDNCCSLA